MQALVMAYPLPRSHYSVMEAHVDGNRNNRANIAGVARRKSDAEAS